MNWPNKTRDTTGYLPMNKLVPMVVLILMVVLVLMVALIPDDGVDTG